MNSTEIIEGNKLISIFMGFKLNKWNEFELRLNGLNMDFPLKISQIKYHCSWDWIMPVVEKIELLKHPVYIISNNCIIYEKVGRNHGWHFDNYGKTKIEATWISVVEFIKFYNKNNNK